MSAGMLLAVTCGTPALADDTELLLINPDKAQQVPNVLLIIDSSGSMGDPEQTREVYDYTTAYTGSATPCDPNYYYWTEYKNVIPSCSSTSRRVLKSSWVCESGMTQMNGIGSYRTRMAQYREGGSGFFSWLFGFFSATQWQEIEPYNETDLVECWTDSGLHGDGSYGNKLYAQRGGNRDPFTDDEDEEVNWYSWPTSQSVTMFDGNYLNYLENPIIVTDSRINIVQNTATAILNSIEGINVGIMRFNNTQGGPVLLGLSDLDTKRDNIIATIGAIPSGGFTPVSETVYESALYWRGMPAYYGELISEHPTDPNALASTGPEIYDGPESVSCAKNYNVVLTDGKPTEDRDPETLVDTLPNWAATLGYSGCTGAGVDGACLDDVSAYLFNEDIDPTLPGKQTVTTHTIGFSIDLPILQEAAQRGGGSYFRADDVQSLTQALLEIVNDIQDRNLSFAAPAVAVNAFNRTQNLNDLYLTQFQASEKIRWPGNLKKYRISGGQIVDANDQPAVDPLTGSFFDSAKSFWSTAADGNNVGDGGAVENLPAPDDRRLFTNNGNASDLTAPGNAISMANINAFNLEDFGLTGAEGEPTIENIIRWIRGEDVADEDLDPATTLIKQMGDPLHSQPAAVAYGGTPEAPEVVVFTATNQGTVHAVDASTGKELWAFMPREHLVNLPLYYINSEAPFKYYGVDGDMVPVVADRDRDGVIEEGDGDFAYLIFGMRRGGDAYYMLDVTDRDNPEVMWRASASEFGQTWSRPTIARVDMQDPNLNEDKAVVIFGGGYDNVHDTIDHPDTADSKGNGVYMLDLVSGQMLWRAGPDSDANLQIPGMTRSIATQIRVIDVNGDGYADRMYASDMGGQILRFDIFDGKDPDGTGPNALVTGGVVAQLGAEGISGTPSVADTRRFYSAPDVSVFNDNALDRRFIAISLGSGYRAHPLDDSNSDRFYSIRDARVFDQMSQAEYDSFVPVVDSELIEVSGTTGVAIPSNRRGWKFTLPADQKVFSNSVTFNNEVFFVAFSADTTNAATCSAGQGANYLYRVAVVNGDPIIDLSTIVSGEEDKARVTSLAQGGIAPSPAFLFPSPEPDCVGDACSPPPVGCIGVECFDPGFENFPVRTLWTQDGIE